LHPEEPTASGGVRRVLQPWSWTRAEREADVTSQGRRTRSVKMSRSLVETVAGEGEGTTLETTLEVRGA